MSVLMKRLGFLGGLLFLVGLACNAPQLGTRPTIPPPPTVGSIQVGTAVPSGQPAATATSEAGLEGEAKPVQLPTFTPRSQATADSANSPNPTPDIVATATPTPTVSASRPLTLDYRIEWQLDPNNSGESVATVTLDVQGGAGDYTYFRDELPTPGPVFTYRWASCASNPGSLRVTAADGQSVKVDYFEKTPCP